MKLSAFGEMKNFDLAEIGNHRRFRDAEPGGFRPAMLAKSGLAFSEADAKRFAAFAENDRFLCF